ncbi:SDR family NAD(P)-dependent oxidoreductase [Nocardia sp. CA2R105]|uniref:type I polyketide synthase n=1 Tax=Nocardia coffeae TaxID=2873381 RepID=UPI001CA6EAF0|nr:type I polyketide synthase [Nocardia coffeae]MBY8858934.1 SDR family NAD(P)-dependent oxidoreductase [Nocardia coffeae]
MTAGSGGTPLPAPGPGQRDSTTTTESDAASVPPVAIIGIGCRVPGAHGVGEFWRLLREGRDGTTAPPRDRAGTRRGGYLRGLDAFDNDWFAISEREAAVLDPQQRLALEVAVEALDDAGVGYRVRGSHTAVLFGACGYDHGTVLLGQGGYDAPYAVTGSALSIIANRLSYALDLHGPSLVLDSACSSSLAAVDMAMRLLADRTVDLAIVGGVNLPLLQHTSDYLDQAGFLAPDGRCKPFDAAADGYTRSEGCTVLILQRTADARREGNRVYAEIVGAAVGSDGRSNGLYAPNGRAQQQVIRQAWARAGADPETVGYVECHGTGTPLGDAVEVGALAAVLSDGERTRRVWIGSVKSNLGHLEAAAGVTGIVKAALSIAHATIAPNVHFHTENPLLKLAARGLAVPTEPIGWAAESAAGRYAGVSSFGFGGTNAHVVLRGMDPVAPQREADPPTLFPVTGRDAEDLRQQALRWAEALGRGTGSLGEFAAAAARSIPEQMRGAVLARDRAEAVARLLELAEAAEPSGPASPEVTSDAIAAASPRTPATVDASDRNAEAHRPTGDDAVDPTAHPAGVHSPSGRRRRGRILLVFSGQGGQHQRMGRGLAARYPVFARALAEATDAVTAAGGPRVWTPRHGFAHSLDTTDLVQPALFVFQIALTELLAHWGIRPDAVIGHSLGEIAAAVVSGALSLGDGARIVVARSAILAQLDGHGAMAMLEATPEEAARLVDPVRAHVSVAAINGPRSVVVSGTPRYVETLIRRATRRSVYARRIAVDFAAHSPQVHEPAAELLARLDGITPRPPRIRLYSTTRPGELITSAALDAKYWAENAERTVELAAAMESAAADGCTTAIEISPHPILAPAIREFPDFREATHPMADRDDEATAFLDGMARLYLEGRSVGWAALGAFPGRILERRWRHTSFPLLTDMAPAPAAEELGDHVVRGVPMVPATYWLRGLLRIAGERTTRLTEFTVREPTDLTALPDVTFRAGTDLLEVSGPVPLATARIAAEPTPAEIVGWMRAIDAHRIAQPGMRAVGTREFYAMLRARGLDYGPRFRPLRGIVAESASAIGLLGHIPLDAAALDGCLQLIAAAAGPHLPANVLPLPARIDSAWLTASSEVLLAQAHAFLRNADSDGLHCDVLVTDQHGAPAAALLGVHIHYVRLPDPPDHSFMSTSAPSRGREGDRPNAFGDTHFTPPWQPGYRWPTGEGSHGPAAQPDTPQDNSFGDNTLADQQGVEGAVSARTGHYLGHYANPVSGQWGRPGTRGNDHPILDRSDWDRGVLGAHGLGPVLRRESWARVEVPDAAGAVRSSRVRRVMVIGESRLAVGLARAMDAWVPAERVARDPIEASPIVSATLAGRGDPTAVVAVWPAVSAAGSAVAEIGRALELLQRIQECDAMASLTVVLRDRRSVTQQGIAGLVRSLQLESGRPVRLVWAGAERAEPGPLTGLALSTAGPDEVRIGPGGVEARRFEPVSFLARPVEIQPVGAYVVTGGLGALGAVAARWLLDSGAGDVVVLTRHPRPLPPLLEGLEDRIVVLRCDVTDPRDLANALHDIRECGAPIRGLIHSAGALHDAEFSAVTTDLLASMFEPKLAATADLLDLTAADPIDFALLFSSATGALGAPGQAAYAAANAALDALAATRANRRVISIGWGSWESGLAATAGGAEHLRRAGITPFTTARGTAVLDSLRGYPGPHVLAMDYTPTTDDSPIAHRLRAVLPTTPQAQEDPTSTNEFSYGPADLEQTTPDDRVGNRRAPADRPSLSAESGYFGALAARIPTNPVPEADTSAVADEYRYTYGPTGCSGESPGADLLADNGVPAGGSIGSGVDRDSVPASDPELEPTAHVPVAQVIRAALAATLGIAAESIRPEVDFTGLGLSSLLAIELRRTLEARLGVRIATAELFEHPTVAMLGAALSARLPDARGETR